MNDNKHREFVIDHMTELLKLNRDQSEDIKALIELLKVGMESGHITLSFAHKRSLEAAIINFDRTAREIKKRLRYLERRGALL